MSDTQAIETEDEIKTNEDNAENVESEEVEIVVEGEEQPASKPVRGDFYKRFNKLTGKIDAANTETEVQRRRADANEEEMKLWRLKAEQTTLLKRPDVDDFDSKAEYNLAADAYDEQRYTAAVLKQTGKLQSDRQSQTSLDEDNRKLETKLRAHDVRAGELKVPDYEETEDKAIEYLGTNLAKRIMASSKYSHLIMYHCGKNETAARNLVNAIAADPLEGVLEIGELGKSLKPKLKHSTAPDPPTIVEGGATTSDWQKRIDKAREEAAVTGDVKKLFDLKKQAKEAGATIG